MVYLFSFNPHSIHPPIGKVRKAIIAYTNCLAVPTKIEAIDILREIYSAVIIPTEVAMEYGTGIPGWIEIVKLLHREAVVLLTLQCG
jgi:predicted nucleic acid-binding protein